MNTRIKYSFTIKLFLILCVFCFSALNAFAANVVSSVNVKQTNSGNYDIILKINNFVNIKKVTNAKDSLSLILDSTVPAESIEIIYDNTSDLKYIILQKKNTDNTLIYMQGKDIENAKIFVKELSTGLLKPLNTKNNYIYITDVKYLSIVLSSIFFGFILLLGLRNKKRKQNIEEYNKIKYQNNTHLQKNKVSNQKRYIPSINYKINTAYNKMSIPENFIISHSQKYKEEKIRKVG